MHVRMCACMCVCVHVSEWCLGVWVCVCDYDLLCVCACVYECVCVCVWVNMCECVYECVWGGWFYFLSVIRIDLSSEKVDCEALTSTPGTRAASQHLKSLLVAHGDINEDGVGNVQRDVPAFVWPGRTLWTPVFQMTSAWGYKVTQPGLDLLPGSSRQRKAALCQTSWPALHC